MRKARAQRLNLSRVFAFFRQQRHAAGHEHTRQGTLRGECHQHGGQTFIASGDAQHAFARRQGTNESAQDGRGIVAIGEAVHHADCALGAPIAGIADETSKGNHIVFLEFPGGGLGEQTYFVMSGVIAQRDGRAIFGADAALGAEDEIFIFARDQMATSPWPRPASSRRHLRWESRVKNRVQEAAVPLDRKRAFVRRICLSLAYLSVKRRGDFSVR